MKNNGTTNDELTFGLAQAIFCLRNRNFDKAYELITETMRIAPNAPQPHNLLGILYELIGNGDNARRHYRAAYSLDPTFTPACKNLEQLCTISDKSKPRIYDFGDEATNGEKKSGY